VHVCDEDRNIELNESASIALFRIAQESLTNVAACPGEQGRHRH